LTKRYLLCPEKLIAVFKINHGGYIPGNLANTGYSYSISQKLKMRQMFGKIKKKSRGVEMKAFSRLPSRLAFFLRDVVPINALTSGHIFLGFSNCGQFLLSYTCTPNETGTPSASGFAFNYVYRLHWWNWIPYAKAKKVAEVTLFTDHDVSGSLHISFCQWPMDSTRMVVFGYQAHDTFLADEMLSNSLHCYMTVTHAPSLINCQACVNVASTYDTDDVAEAWNSCIRMSCLKHGATVHTQFDIVSPYPKFEPRISLKVLGTVLINTGNYFHAISFDIEDLSKVKGNLTVGAATPGCTPLHISEHIYRSLNPAASPAYNPTSVHVGMNEYTFGTGWSPKSMTSPHGSQYTMPSPLGSTYTMPSPMGSHSMASPHGSHVTMASPQGRGGESDNPGSLDAAHTTTFGGNNCCYHNNTTPSSPWSSPVPETTRKSPRIRSMTASLVQRVSQPGPSYKSPKKESSKFSSPSKSNTSAATNTRSSTLSDKKRKLADKAYDLTEENFASDVPEKLSTFRRKRLAERKYEFTEEEDEKRMIPITRLRAKKLNEKGSVLTRVFQESTEDVMVCVTERKTEDKENETSDKQNTDTSAEERQKAEEDYWSDILEEASYPELFSPGGCIKKDTCAVSPRSPKVISAAISPRPGCGGSSQPEFQCKVKFTRRFIEVDDELISVITDVEENEERTILALPGFLFALPMEVHGAGYTQMQMVSNTVAERLTHNCIRVEQRSLDLEQFCHETATKLCAATNKKFWFTNDYDVEVIDLDPGSGDVVAVAVILIQAAILTKSQSTKFNVSSLSRKHYQASFKFKWNLETGNYSVVDSDPFKEMYGFKESPDHWNPARSVAASYIRKFRCEDTRIKVLNNQSVINGASLKAVVDPENLVALIMNDLE